MEKKKSEKDKKNKVTVIKEEVYRKRYGFLPYYSNTFFEKKKAMFRLLPILCIIVIYTAILCFYLRFNMLLNGFFLVAFLVCAAVFLSWLITKVASSRMEKFGYTISDDGVHKDVWNVKTIISYEDIREAVIKNKVMLTSKAAIVPTGKGTIKFSYEVGSTTAQKHMLECYKLLSNKLHLTEVMPKLDKDIISDFDKSYFYNKSFIKCIIALIIEILFTFLFCNIVTDIIALYMMNSICAMSQYFTIYRLYKSVRLGKENADDILKKTSEIPKVKLSIIKHSYLEYLIIILGVIAINFFIIYKVF